jgi:hypothetical protein
MCKDMLGCMALVLQLPNITRVSGYYLMLVSALCSKHLLTLFVFNSNYTDLREPLNLLSEEWQKAAEFESVLRHLNILTMEVQKANPAAISLTWLEICI